MTSPEPWNPTPPASALMDRQQWLNEGGDWVGDEAEERSRLDEVDELLSWERPLKMESDDAGST